MLINCIRKPTLVFTLLLLVTESVLANPSSYLIPDPVTYKAFLYNEWQASRPTVTIFVDPHCPYCKKSIPKYSDITDYNVFVFWMPIFGERSESFIAPFFKCDRPTSKAILTSILDQSFLEALKDCNNDEQDAQALRQLNDDLVNAYTADAVPSYFVQGVRTYLSQLYSRDEFKPVLVNGVRLKWDRYQLNQQALSTGEAKNLAIYYPKGVDTKELALIEKYQPKYIFSQISWDQVCKYSQLQRCDNSSDQQKRLGLSKEFAALLGFDDSESVLLIDLSGRLVSP